MPLTQVSITDFRNNLANYLRNAKYKGESLVIVDEKLGEPMAELSPPKGEKEENWEEYMKLVENAFGAWKKYPKDKNREKLRKADRKTIRNRIGK